MKRLAVVLTLCALAAPILAQQDPRWTERFEPFRMIGNIYYVGTRGLASFLIATPDGAVLLDTGVESNGALLRASVEKLDFTLRDIRILLDGHAHFDHVGTHAEMARLTGARVMVMSEDAKALSTGQDLSALAAGKWPPVKVDRVLKDGDTVALGATTLTAHRTAGHTGGCTTWTTTVQDGGKTYQVAFVCSLTVVADRLVDQPAQPTMVEDYARAFAYLKSLKADVWFSEHGEFFDLEGKRKRLTSGGQPNPFVDPAGYQAFVSSMEAAYQKRLATP